MRESFVFYKEFKEAIDTIKSKEKKLMFYECITEYVFYEKLPDNVDKEITSMFILVKKKLDNINTSFWNYEDRRSSKYKKWKKEILNRDNYQCKKCGKEKDLVVHHIKEFSKYKEDRFDINNGITLCQKCHREVHKK